MKSRLLCAAAFVLAPVGVTSAHAQVSVEEIVVTAQRREESLQTVPIAIAAVTAKSLAAQGITDTASLPTVVPGLDFTRQANAATPFIRGVGTPIGSPGNEASVATYIDGVYLGNGRGTLFSFNNIERVEVLKGPQGTLFGRNATGGVVQVVTKDPSHEPSADLALGYGKFDTSSLSVYATTGLTETLAADIAVYGMQRRDGWGRNVTTGDDTFTGSTFGVRTKWLWAPTDDLKLTLAADYGRNKGEEGLGVHFFPGAISANGTGYAGFYNATGRPNDYWDNKQEGASLRAAYDLGWATAVSISSYRNTRALYVFDQDATPAAQVNARVYTQSISTTQEFQLLSPAGAPFSWIVGAFYYADSSRYRPINIVGLFQVFARQETESYSAYGQTSFEIFPDAHLTAGLRYTSDDRSLRGVRTNGAGTAVTLSGYSTTKNNKLTWRLAADYKVTPTTLAYASYSRGFKSGAYNLLNVASPAVQPEVIDAYEIGTKSDFLDRTVRLNLSAFYYDYKDIQVPAIVAGGSVFVNAAAATIYGGEAELEWAASDKLTIRGGLSLLHGEYDSFPGMQTSLSNPVPPACAIGTAGCGGNRIVATDGKGKTTVHTPKATLNLAATYRVPTRAGDYALTLSYYRNAGFYWEPDNKLKQPAYDLVNATAEWTSVSGRWGLQLWGRNLLNTKYLSYAVSNSFGDHGSPAEPFTAGATVKAHF